MKIMKYILSFFLLFSFFTSCMEKAEIEQPVGRIETASFSRDTFSFSESSGNVTLDIVASKYLNYATFFTVEVEEFSLSGYDKAVEGVNFTIPEKTVKMLLGKDEIGVELRIIDDTVISANNGSIHRAFKVSITSMKGGCVPALTSQACTVIIRNDDYVPTSQITFAQVKDTVRENAGEYFLPIKLNMSSESEEVKVTIAQTKTEGQIAEAFRFQDDVLTLVGGALEGELALRILNNNDVSENEIDFVEFVIRDVEGAGIGADSIFRLYIEDDDVKRELSFGQKGLVYHETGDTLQIPMIITGGYSMESLASGDFAISEYINCEAEDVELLTESFKSAGKDTIMLKAVVKDNSDYGEWGFRLMVENRRNITFKDSSSYIVNVKDDERLLRFEETMLEIEEGESFSIPIILAGGPLDKDVRVSVELVEDGTTATEEQYELSSDYPSIVKGSASTTYIFKTKTIGSILSDRKVKLKVTLASSTPHGQVHYNETQYCDVVIKNTNTSVGFESNDYLTWTNDTVVVPLNIVCSGPVAEGSILELGVKEGSMTGVEYKVLVGDQVFVNGEVIHVPLDKNDHIKVLFTSVDTTIASGSPIFEIVDLFGGSFAKENIDTDNSICLFRVVTGYKKLTIKDILVSHSANSVWVGGAPSQGDAAAAVDGDNATMWHAAHTANDIGVQKPPYILNYELDDAYVINQMEMIGRPTYLDRVKGALIQGSLDGNTWFTLFNFKSDFATDNSSGKIKHKELRRAKYLRVRPVVADNHAAIMEIYLWTVDGLGIE